MGELFNRKGMTKRRQALRNAMPDAEVILWAQIRKRQILGKKFRRQVSVGRYVVDFYCPELHLVIEVDGESHFSMKAIESDRLRQRWIEDKGVRFLRFTNSDVCFNLNGVLETIYETVSDLSGEAI